MDKKKFLNIFEGEDKNLIAGVYEDIELCKKIGYQVYTDIFLPPHIWSRIMEMESSLGITTYTLGINEEAEKRVCMFSPAGDEVYSYDYPVTFFTIEGGNKFKELEHRHFLAAIMGLGIKREKMGDLIVRDGVCYGIIKEELFEFLVNNLAQVGKTEVEVKSCQSEKIPLGEYEEEIYLVSSLRLDNIVAAITGQSRNASVSVIEDGLVVVNYSVKRRKDLTVKEGDGLSIRRYGKFIFKEVIGESKKGKQRILLKKYV